MLLVHTLHVEQMTSSSALLRMEHAYATASHMLLLHFLLAACAMGHAGTSWFQQNSCGRTGAIMLMQQAGFEWLQVRDLEAELALAQQAGAVQQQQAQHAQHEARLCELHALVLIQHAVRCCCPKVLLQLRMTLCKPSTG